MQVTSHEDVVMFARYCRARFGKTAGRTARARAKALAKRGDTQGHAVWNEVADEIERAAKVSPRKSK
jgi:hypothetical protein